MNKIKFGCLTLMAALCFVASAHAGVTFLPAASGGIGGSSGSSHAVSTAQRCINEGYRSSCSGRQRGVDKCPYNSSYYRSCCSEDYKFTREECINAGLRPSNISCGGLHRCR